MSIENQQIWLQGELGAYLQAQEQAVFDQVVTDLFGFNAVQIGMLEMDLLRNCRIPFVFRTGLAQGSVYSAPEFLPIRENCIDLLLLPHALEFSQNPHQVLREAKPLAVLGVHGSLKWAALVGVWLGALGGVAFKIFWLDRFPKLGGAMYIIVGWAGIVILPAMWHRPGTLALVALGGVLYTLGAILFALHRPVLSERWFGYHEVWHAFGIAAGVVLFVANAGLVRAG